MDRRHFIYASFVLGVGAIASCATKVPLKDFEQKVAMPGEEGFLEESNLEKWMDRYWGAEDFAEEALGLDEIDLSDYDNIVKDDNNVKTVCFHSYDMGNYNLRQALAVSHPSNKKRQSIYVSMTKWDHPDFYSNNRLIYEETRRLDIKNNSFASLVSERPWDEPRPMYPVTIVYDGSQAVDVCNGSPKKVSDIPKAAAIIEYTYDEVLKAKRSGKRFEQILKGRSMENLPKDDEFKDIINAYLTH